ncbi:MAG: hypothetical protein ACT4OK_19230 [Gemmobacter sp.]
MLRLQVLLLVVGHVPTFAEAQAKPDLLAGVWEGEVLGLPDSFRVWIELAADGSGKIVYPTRACEGTVVFLREQRGDLIYSERIDSGTERCRPEGELELALTADGLLKYGYVDIRLGVRRAAGRLTRVSATSAAAPALSASPDTGIFSALFVPDGSRFIGQVRGQPGPSYDPRRPYKYDPFRTYDADILFNGTATLVRFRIGGNRDDFACLGGLRILSVGPSGSANGVFSRTHGRSDRFIDCPEQADMKLTKVGGGLQLDWTPPGREQVSGVLTDVTAEIAAERAVAAAAARNAEPCTHAKWAGVLVDIADTLICDEGKTLTMLRKGSHLKLRVTEVSFTDGSLIGVSMINSVSGKGTVQVVCRFPADSEIELSTGDLVEVIGTLNSYSRGRLTLDCEQVG